MAYGYDDDDRHKHLSTKPSKAFYRKVSEICDKANKGAKDALVLLVVMSNGIFCFSKGTAFKSMQKLGKNLALPFSFRGDNR